MHTVYCPICNYTHKVGARKASEGAFYVCEYCFSINQLGFSKRFGIYAEQVKQDVLDDIKHEKPAFYKDLMTAKRLLMRRNGEQFH